MAERTRIFLVLAFGFVLLGVSITMQGVVWPSVAEDFGRPLSNLGFVTLAYGAGYTLSTLYSGRLARSPGIGASLLMSAVGATAGLALLAASPSFLVYVAGAGVAGLAGGLVDAGTNTHVAITRGAREMGLIHGSVGIGSIAGPLAVTALLEAGIDWRVAFAAMAAAHAMYAIPVRANARGLDVSVEAETSDGRLRVTSPVVLWSMIVFLAYAGMATSAGVWVFTYLTEHLGFADGTAGLVVGAYFAGFTASRFVLSALGDRFDPDRVLQWSAVASFAGFLVFWASPYDWLAVVAFVAAGFAHASIFPLEILLTPRRVGQAGTARLVGLEIAAANVGGAALPAVVGLAVGAAGLSVIPPLIVALALALVAAVEVLRRHSRRMMA